jgi:hypothetical protein
MSRFVGIAALIGALLLFALWMKQHEIESAVHRLERYEFPQTSDAQ